MPNKYMKDSDNLRVFGDTNVGWCENTPINETLDGEGNVATDKRGFGVRDPYAPTARRHDDPSVCELREKLRKHNGIHELDICDPDELDRAATIFWRDGFVVVRNLLNTENLDRFREGSARVLSEILAPDGEAGRKYLTETNRLPHRYSYGTTSSSRQLLHDSVWASMVDLDTTTPLLTKLFGSKDYVVLGAGGDLCLPGAVEYQHLHSDVREDFNVSKARVEQAEAMGIKLETPEDSDELTMKCRRLIADRTPAVITINFLMCDLTWENGPIRQIPGTHMSARHPPPPQEEPEWMRMSTLVGGPAGAGVFRDNRAWHGATPNLSHEIRSMPNVEYGAPWIAGPRVPKTMPHRVWETLSDHARHICRFVHEEPGVWPAGAGINHSLESARRKAKQEVNAPPNYYSL